MREIVKCSHCEYRWFTTSSLKLVTCPNCGLKTHNVSEGSEDSEAPRM